MDIILLRTAREKPLTLHLTLPFIVSITVAFAVMLGALVAGGYWWATYQHRNDYGPQVVARWQQQVRHDQAVLEKLHDKSANVLHAMTIKFANMQARLVRLDALGERLVKVADIDSGEFNFDHRPGLGGPETGVGVALKQPNFMHAVDKLSAQLARRQQQLKILDGLLQQKQLTQATKLAGRPANHTWVSSPFGMRVDPFSGKLHMHGGMDFAGEMGTPVHATGAGVVTWAGPRSGYGNMIQIYHSSGLSTRYGHCEKLLVKPGDVVSAGQEICLMGSTGRSTGAHVHYEVLKNGVAVNPAPYVHRKRH